MQYNRIMQMLQKIKNWYQGESKSYQDSGEFGVIFLLYVQRHWTSNIVHYIVNFYSKHWEFVWGIVFSVFFFIVGT